MNPIVKVNLSKHVTEVHSPKVRIEFLTSCRRALHFQHVRLSHLRPMLKSRTGFCRSLASAWRSSVGTLQAPQGRGLFASAWINSGHDKTDSPEQKKGLVTDPDLAPPKPESGKHDTPSSQKTNELVLLVIKCCRLANSCSRAADRANPCTTSGLSSCVRVQECSGLTQHAFGSRL